MLAVFSGLQDVIRQAEEHLKAVSAQPGYAIAVLQVW